jgi:hypothetical protein
LNKIHKLGSQIENLNFGGNMTSYKIAYQILLVKLDNYIVFKITNEKHNYWINNLFIRLRKYVLFHVYNVLHAGNHKTQTLWSFVNWGIFERRTKTNFIIQTPKGRQICFRTFLNVSYFVSQETRKANLY